MYLAKINKKCYNLIRKNRQCVEWFIPQKIFSPNFYFMRYLGKIIFSGNKFNVITIKYFYPIPFNF